MGPVPAFGPRRALYSDSVGTFMDFTPNEDPAYHSSTPGVDFIFVPTNESLTIRLRFVILKITDARVCVNLLGLVPEETEQFSNLEEQLIPGQTEFQHAETLYIIQAVTA